jgi:hypothetical protein
VGEINPCKTAGSSLPLLNEAVLVATEQISFSDFATARIYEQMSVLNRPIFIFLERKITTKSPGL